MLGFVLGFVHQYVERLYKSAVGQCVHSGIECVLVLGTHHARSPYQARKVRLTNQFILLAAVFHCAYFVVYALNGLWRALWEPIIFWALSFVVLVFNTRGWFASAKGLLLLMGNLAVLYAAFVFNKQIPATQHMLAAVMLCAFWLMDESRAERVVLWLTVLTSLVFFFLIEADPWHHPLASIISFTETSLLYMRVLVPLSTFFLMIAGALYFQHDMLNAEWKLGEQNKLLEHQAVEIQLANNELMEKNLHIEHEHRRLQSLYDNTTLLSQIGQRVTASSQLEDVFMALYNGVQEFMEVAAFGIATYNERLECLDFQFIVEEGKRQEPTVCSMNNDNLLAVYCARYQQEVWLHDVEREASRYVRRLENASAGRTAQSLVYLPLLVHERLVGVMTVQSFKTQAYSQYQVDMLRTLSFYAASALENASERARSESLLLNILPAPIAERLKSGEMRIAEHYDSVTVMFIDLVGFTMLSAQQPAQAIVTMLDKVFSTFDDIAERYSLEKIKTIGDAYMVVGGIPTPLPDHVERVGRAAIEMLSAVKQLSHELRLLSNSADYSADYSDYSELSVRIGIDTGSAVAGVIGTKKFSYDLWGDTVNTASRMESSGAPGTIHVTEAVRERLQHCCLFEQCEPMDIKGKGMLQTYLLLGFRDDVKTKHTRRNTLSTMAASIMP